MYAGAINQTAMNNIIYFPMQTPPPIEVPEKKRSKTKEAVEEKRQNLTHTSHGRVKARAAEPITDLAHIQAIKNYFLNKKQFRNHMMFIMGITLGLRIGDLLSLRISDVLNENGLFKSHIYLREEKTGKANSPKLTEIAKEAIQLYLDSLKKYELDQYLFKSRKGENQPIDTSMAYRVLKEVCDHLELPYHVGTHTLRKTFAYWTIRNNQDNPVILAALQEMLNHSDQKTTLRYAGITAIERDNISVNLAELFEGMQTNGIPSAIG